MVSFYKRLNNFVLHNTCSYSVELDSSALVLLTSLLVKHFCNSIAFYFNGAIALVHWLTIC